jgi:hypothetical protein
VISRVSDGAGAAACDAPAMPAPLHFDGDPANLFGGGRHAQLDDRRGRSSAGGSSHPAIPGQLQNIQSEEAAAPTEVASEGAACSSRAQRSTCL